MLSLLFLGCALGAQDGFRCRSVSVFKNASAFFVKVGTVPAADKKWRWQEDTMPAPLEGSFWVSIPDNELVSLKSSLKDKKEMVFAGSHAELLEANAGKRVRLYFQYDTVPITGTVQLLKNPDQPARLFAFNNGSSINFVTEAQLSNLRRIEFLEAANMQREEKKQMPTLDFEFKNAKAQQPLGLMYLQKNLSWNPEYKLELYSDDKKAKLTMQAAVVNEAEDFETEELNLVAGVPNFKYAAQLHRFVKYLFRQPDQYEFLSALSGTTTISNFALDNSSMTNAFQTYNERSANIPVTTLATGELDSNIDGTAVEDMYYYTLKNIELKRGERALYDVFSQEVNVEHIYEAQLPENPLTYYSSYNADKITHKVGHHVKLRNGGNHVWTSGSVLVLSNQNGKFSPVCQDALKYTSMQEERKIYLTEAPDVSVRSQEKELERKSDDKKINRDRYAYYYDLVTVQGEIELQNYKDKTIRLDIKRLIHGDLIESSEKWQTTRLPVVNGNTLSPSSNVCWELTLNAKEKKTITYKYKVYVLRYNRYE